jgi:hypothetical protein
MTALAKNDPEAVPTKVCPTKEFASDVDSLATLRINAGIDPSLTKAPESRSTPSKSPI